MAKKFKRRFRKRRFVRSKRFTRRVRRIARGTVWKMAETKFYTQPVSITPNTAGAYAKSFFDGLDQGIGTNARVGSKIVIKKWGFKLQSLFNWNSFDSNQYVGAANARFRVMVLYPRKSVTTPDLTSYLTPTVPGLYDRPDPTRFMVLYDKFRLISDSHPYVRLNDIEYPLTGGGTKSHYTFKFFKSRPLVLNYGSGTVINREPILYITCDLLPIGDDEGSSVFFGGYVSASYKDF